MTIKTLDDKWSECIRLKYKGLDLYSQLRCGKYQIGTDPHHVVPKNRGRAVRWDIRNGVWLVRFTHTKIHADSEEYNKFIEWFREREDYDDIVRNANKVIHVDLDEVNDVLEKYIQDHT